MSTPPRSPVRCRVLAAAVLVPFIEELLMRGWLLRACVQWQQARSAGGRDPLGDVLDRHSIHQVPAGAWTWTAIAASSLVFAAGHAPQEWPAALAYGLLMATLWIVRRDLLSCVIAHGVTNAGLALTVLATGRPEFW